MLNNLFFPFWIQNGKQGIVVNSIQVSNNQSCNARDIICWILNFFIFEVQKLYL